VGPTSQRHDPPMDYISAPMLLLLNGPTRRAILMLAFSGTALSPKWLTNSLLIDLNMEIALTAAVCPIGTWWQVCRMLACLLKVYLHSRQRNEPLWIKAVEVSSFSCRKYRVMLSSCPYLNNIVSFSCAAEIRPAASWLNLSSTAWDRAVSWRTVQAATPRARSTVMRLSF
jgi:hypothetical protein